MICQFFQGKQNRVFQTKWFILVPRLHCVKECDTVLYFTCANHNEKQNWKQQQDEVKHIFLSYTPFGKMY